jgi:hypothetical protein
LLPPSPRKAVGRVARLSEAKASGVGGTRNQKSVISNQLEQAPDHSLISDTWAPHPHPLPTADAGGGEEIAATFLVTWIFVSHLSS